MESIPNTRTRDYLAQRPTVKANTTGQKKKKKTTNDILLYSYIDTLFNHHQKSFLLQQVGTDTETHSQTLHRDRETLEYTTLNRMSPSTL